jgi:hypothetical protein
MTNDDASGAATQLRWDREALRAGVSICLTMAVPLRLIAALLDSDSGGLRALLFFVYLVIFVIGAGCAAWVQRVGTPMSHAVVAAVGTALVVEVVLTAIRLARGTGLPWFSTFFTISLISVCGLIGGILGSRLRGRGVLPSSQQAPR